MEREEPTPSEDPTYRASSSSTSPRVGDSGGGTKRPKGNNYEVFLSFRGKDTREGFTDYLYTSLVDAGIHVFRDDNELRVGEEIGPELLHSITQSKISIPIISEGYSSSKWCLRELAQMLKCRKSQGQIVLPIFYKVEPSQPLGNAINAHKANLGENIVKEWEEALKEVSSLKGWESKKINNGHEGELVKIVVGKVISELKRKFQLTIPKELVGVDDRVREIMSLIDAKITNTTIIGICGMGGIGKTTLAKVLYNNLSSHFEHLSFLTNIRETSARKGIECLQKQLICDILRSPYDVSNVEEGISVIRSRFTSKRVLIVLDDVDDNTHLNALAKDTSWFEAGSIIIITTRNKSILEEVGTSHIYQLKELPLDQSLILFSRHAFRKDSPWSDYEVISDDVVSIIWGLPLALEVIGSFLRGKEKEVWEDTLKKLKKVPHKKVREKLKISYDALDYDEQQMFLDIACFLIGSDKQSASYMWDACDFFPAVGIKVLSNLSLIKIGEEGKLWMHDQLRDLGMHIVHQENPKKPHKRSRLWNYMEAKDVLDNSKGTRKIEALRLVFYTCTAEQFKELTNLRLFQTMGANFMGDFQNLFPQLRWLEWHYCPSNFAAANFHPKKLVVLDLSYSYISENWGGWGPLKVATELKVLKLKNCQYLKRTPDLSAFKSLEILNVDGCWKLEEIHPSIGDLKMLISLNVNGCYQLKELPESIGSLMKLETLNAFDCESLTRIPSSICHLASLSLLDLFGCRKLTRLPVSIGSLMSLTELNVARTAIAKLPKSIVNLQNLTILDISGTNITELPRDIGMLAKLQELTVTGCKNLEGVFSNIARLTMQNRFILGWRKRRSKLFSVKSLSVDFRELDVEPKLLSGFRDLRITCQSRSLPHLSHLSLLNVLALSDCSRLACLPELPVGLSKLWITGCGELKALTNLSSLKRLSELIIKKCFELTEVTGLEGLQSLSNLEVRDCPKICRLGAVESLESSRGLHIDEAFPDSSKLTSAKVSRPEGSLDLSNSKILQETITGSCENLAEIEGLGGSKSSLTLDFFECTSTGQSQDLSGLKCVRESHFTNCSNLTEIHRLDGLIFLKFLDMSGCTSLGQSLDLSNLEYLETLKAANCKNLVEIRGLDGLESLEYLDISGCTSLGQSLDLSNLEYLQTLKVANCENLVEIRGLDGSESLEHLDISGCTSLRHSLDFSNLENLQTLKAANCENLVEIRGLDASEFLKHLDISGCTSLGQSLDLSNLEYLETLKAANCENLVEIRGLDGLESLEYLDISSCTSLGQSLDLSNLEYLQTLKAANCKDLVGIRGLNGSESLEHLDISGCTSLRHSLDFSKLKNLETLKAANCENLIEIQGLDSSKFLRSLNISGCTSLRQSLNLSNLKHLSTIYAANCTNLVEIQGLDGLELLWILDISGCTSLRQSLNLSNLKCLSTIYATNCTNLVEIQGLDGLEFLWTLDISGCTSLRQSLNLSNLKHLLAIRAANCTNLVEIQGLDGLEFLGILDISGCTSLRQSLNLSNLKHLTAIRAANCTNLVEIQGFDGLECLQNRDVSGCMSLRQSTVSQL